MRCAHLAALCAFFFTLDVGRPCAAQQSGIANPSFEEGRIGEAPPGWRFSGDGVTALQSSDAARSGRSGLAIAHAAEAQPSGFGGIIQGIDAAPYRNRRIRMTAAASVEGDPDASGHFWLRVDGPERRLLFFDNMGDRPIRASDWAEYEINAQVPNSAEAIVFGFFLIGRGAAHIDDFSIVDLGPIGEGDVAPRPLSRRGLDNLTAFARLFGYVRYFHPSDEAANANWEQIALIGVERVEAASSSRALRHTLAELFAPVAPSIRIVSRNERAPDAAATGDLIAWRHMGLGLNPNSIYRSERVTAPNDLPAFARLELPRGLVAFVPLRVARGADGRTQPIAASVELRSQKPAGFLPTGDDRTSRLAAIILAWNVFQHFYPYFDVVGVDWSAELSKGLRAAGTDRDAAAFDLTLKRLVAALEDGHGGVYRDEPRGAAPIEWEWIENALVITNVGESAGNIHVGDIVRAIDGRPAEELIAEREALISAATPDFRRWRALSELTRGPAGASRMLTLERETGAVDARLEFVARSSGGGFSWTVSRPPNLTELEPGILYVDLARITESEIEANMTHLSTAEAIVFDMRGYPSGAARTLLPHFFDRPLESDQFNVPIHTQPDRRDATFRNGGWRLEPQTPRFAGRFVFMTDGRAVSYAESIMGIVESYRLGEIVGARTAGTNGNINPFALLTGHRILWTGMQVLNRDGSPHHGVGVLPTIPAHRTIAGVRAGRDEVLERTIEIARPSRPAEEPASR